MSNLTAEALVIRNLAMLEDVRKLHETEIGPKVCKEIDKLVETWAQEQSFDGEYSLWEEENILFYPTVWKYRNERDKDAWKAGYDFVFVDKGVAIKTDDGDFNYYLSPILCIGPVKAGIRFFINFKAVKAKSVGSWKKYVQNHESYNELNKKGFEPLGDGDWFIKWSLDCYTLASNYEAGNIADALAPISETLEKIRQAHPIFEKLYSDAEPYFIANP